ncbi:hypothetical protein RIF29_30187 [Crotalaria pallida]|uniref:Uncharacterized protein n=1 Tax=Crotalaria pallida TaxID=3830 RepID=A0AAN9EGN9_CROPI
MANNNETPNNQDNRDLRRRLTSNHKGRGHRNLKDRLGRNEEEGEVNPPTPLHLEGPQDDPHQPSLKPQKGNLVPILGAIGGSLMIVGAIGEGAKTQMSVTRLSLGPKDHLQWHFKN